MTRQAFLPILGQSAPTPGCCDDLDTVTSTALRQRTCNPIHTHGGTGNPAVVACQMRIHMSNPRRHLPGPKAAEDRDRCVVQLLPPGAVQIPKRERSMQPICSSPTSRHSNAMLQFTLQRPRWKLTCDLGKLSVLPPPWLSTRMMQCSLDANVARLFPRGPLFFHHVPPKFETVSGMSVPLLGAL